MVPTNESSRPADHKAQESLFSELFVSPAAYLRVIDVPQQLAYVDPMSRESYSESVFLDHRTVSLDAPGISVPWEEVRSRHQEVRPEPKRINIIFHVAFCGSTFLCRCLDCPGACIPYKEPYALHQVAFFKRTMHGDKSAAYVDYVPLVLDALSRTFSELETALIKPSDSCVNIAREMLAYQPESAAILLYAQLKPHLISILKAEPRRMHAHRMVDRTKIDLDQLGVLGDVDVNSLSDARKVAYVWLGLMYSYMDLLRDERVNVKSLNAAALYEFPMRTLEVAAGFFDLALPPEYIQSVERSGWLNRNAKKPGVEFDQGDREEEAQRVETELADEISDAIRWVDQITRDAPIPAQLPRPLLAR